MIKLLEKIAKKQIVNKKTSKQIEDILFSNIFNDRLPRWIPNVPVIHKTGTTAYVRNDVGYVKAPFGIYAISVMTDNIQNTKGGTDNEAVLTIADISELTYNYFAQKNNYYYNE